MPADGAPRRGRLRARRQQKRRTRLGFALLLQFFEPEGRFSRDVGELPKVAVKYMAEQGEGRLCGAWRLRRNSSAEVDQCIRPAGAGGPDRANACPRTAS